MRAGEVLRSGGQAAHHPHQAFRAHGERLMDRATVVVDGGAARAGRGGGEHAAAAEAGHGQAAFPNELCRALDSAFLDDVAPRRNRPDAGASAAFDHLRQRPGFDGRTVERKPIPVVAEVAHYASMPRTAITRRMRTADVSGSGSNPAASASRESSARCSVERAPSCPPTMVKWSCRPLR